MENTNIAAELETLWPDKFSESEMSAWTEKFARFNPPDAVKALRNWKINSRYKPTWNEIAKQLPAPSPTSQPHEQSPYRTICARQVVRANPNMSGRPEAELILRDYRYWMHWRQVGQNGAEFYPVGSDEPARRFAWMRNDCARMLTQAGWELQHAEQAADWIGSDKPAFEEYVASLTCSYEIPDFN
jgi:hypothetical protein